MKVRGKIYLLLLWMLLIGRISFGQSGWDDKIFWSFKVQKIDDSHALIIANAKLIDGWHLFSVNHDPEKADLTGYPTKFEFKESSNYRLIGSLKDGKEPHVHEDELGVSLYFEGNAVFNQKIEILTDQPFEIVFDYSFQICDENGCLFPPDQEGKVKISGYSPRKGRDTNKLTINGDFATDQDGNAYVYHNLEWVKVPEGNSAKFYKHYLELGGKYEDQ